LTPYDSVEFANRLLQTSGWSSVGEAFAGLHCNPTLGKVAYGDVRYVVVRGKFFSELLELLNNLCVKDQHNKQFSSKFASNFLFEVAYYIGSCDEAYFCATLTTLANQVQTRLHTLIANFANMGFGKLHFGDVTRQNTQDDFLLEISVSSSVESELFPSAATTVCFLTSGYLSAYLSQIFGFQLLAAEIVCTSASPHAHLCEFVVSTPDKIEAIIKARCSENLLSEILKQLDKSLSVFMQHRK